MSPEPSFLAQAHNVTFGLWVLWHHKTWGIYWRSEALSASEERLRCIQWLFLLITVFEVQSMKTANWITLNYIELLLLLSATAVCLHLPRWRLQLIVTACCWPVTDTHTTCSWWLLRLTAIHLAPRRKILLTSLQRTSVT